MKKDEFKRVTFCTNMELSFLFLSFPSRKREGEKERQYKRCHFMIHLNKSLTILEWICTLYTIARMLIINFSFYNNQISISLFIKFIIDNSCLIPNRYII